MICPYCSRTLKEGDKFCTYCGNHINIIEKTPEVYQTEKQSNYCVRCGNKLNIKDKFCKKCGLPTNCKTICVRCGGEIKKGDKFCINCGLPQNLTKVCKNCGTLLKDTDNFCIRCGEVVSQKEIIIHDNNSITEIDYDQKNYTIPSPQPNYNNPYSPYDPYDDQEDDDSNFKKNMITIIIFIITVIALYFLIKYINSAKQIKIDYNNLPPGTFV